MHKKYSPLPLLLAVCLLAASSFSLKAQTTETDTVNYGKMLREIISNAFRLIGSIGDNFSNIKGDYLTKMDGNIEVYKVKEPVNHGAISEFIMVKPNGYAYYVAIISTDENILTIYDVAYSKTLNIYANTRKPVIRSDRDNAISTDDKTVYSITMDNIKVGTYAYDKIKKSVNIIIGFL